MTEPLTSPGLIEFYLAAKSWVEQSAFADEIQWQAGVTLPTLSESSLLREYAWVVLNSGFRESVVRKHFDFISLCYCDWQSAEEIFELGDICSNSASAAFGNMKKLRAITHTAGVISRRGFSSFRTDLMDDFFGVASTLPYIGSITVRHLAKNLGINAAKPDRHLARLAGKFGYSVDEMCSVISNTTGDSLSVADIVLWRFEEQARARWSIGQNSRSSR